MDRDQRLLEEAYTKVLKEESSLEKVLKDTQKEHEAFQNKKAETSKDLSQPVSGQLGHDEKGNFVYVASMYKPEEFYKSRVLYHLFDADLKEVPHGTPIKEGMLWTEQSINTIKVYRATNVNGRLMKVEVPREEVKKESLDGLISERELQQIADEKYKGNIDLARGMHIIKGALISFFVKRYSSDQIHRALKALLEVGRILQPDYDHLVSRFAPKLKEKEMDDALSKDFDIKALEDF